ncbi:RDD family protein [Streptomyces sp. VRA16 Mangrove soil]|uniref:RDD family protein n=1 Tax=Streptomyces sp. VRA16 Mangrove soil TaxID=2817434 RepID=UPI001A9FCB70|nr:RDD family protein [Streptomyces sp. VRA16 Mangrove soil]MBO1337741.1 RDD family protein [Streptomyces sp. VRA16 Mangrove soil]
MSTEPPPNGSGQPPDDDPFRKPPPTNQGGGSPYDNPQDQTPRNPYDNSGGAAPPPPPYGGTPPPYGGDPYGGGAGFGGAADPLAGMPPLADSGKRVLARILDMILIGIIVGLLSWAFHIASFSTDTDDINAGKQAGSSLLTAVLYVGYDVLMTARTGQTLGKRLMKLRVANLNDGATPGMQANLIRALVLWIPFSFCCACIWTAISGGWSFFDKPYKQGLHDKAAKTVVVSSG